MWFLDSETDLTTHSSLSSHSKIHLNNNLYFNLNLAQSFFYTFGSMVYVSFLIWYNTQIFCAARESTLHTDCFLAVLVDIER